MPAGAPQISKETGSRAMCMYLMHIDAAEKLKIPSKYGVQADLNNLLLPFPSLGMQGQKSDTQMTSYTICACRDLVVGKQGFAQGKF